MQIWIYFAPGGGGDGFANLLEQANSVVKHDSFPYHWRIHRRVDNLTKFGDAPIDQNQCFRRFTKKFDIKENKLKQSYVDCVVNNKTIICTSHDTALKFFHQHDCQEILTKDLVKVLLTCKDYKYIARLSAIKLLFENPDDAAVHPGIPHDFSKFDHVLEIEKIHSDWNYVQNFCQRIGLELSESSYRDYQDILAGSNKFDPPWIEIYQTQTTNGMMSYVRQK